MESTELRVFGQKLVIKHADADPKLVRRVIDLVTAKVGEAQARTKNTAPHEIALLALLDLAGEYLMAKDRTEEFKREVELKSESVLKWIGMEKAP